MKRGKVIFVSALILGLVLGVLITAKFNLSSTTNAEEKAVEEATSAQNEGIGTKSNFLDENAFIKVAEEVGPAVVSVSTERVERMRVRFYEGPFGRDDFFDQFFRDFFGELPEREFKERGLGSGVIIDKDGYVLTNEHIISNAEKIAVTLPDGREFKGTLKGKDPRSDLAIIKIDAKNLPVAKLGDSNDVKIGQWAIAIGNPFGFMVHSPKPTVTIGIISALERSLPRIAGRDRDYTGLIQTDAAINPGNSGGPLVNIKGEVIGINVAIFSTSGGYQGVGFAIPINTAKDIVDTLIAGKKVLYGWLGVSVQEIDQKLAEYFNLPDEEGVLAAKVLPNSPAEKGGLKEGDIIRRFDGKNVKDLKSFLDMVTKAKVGSKVKIAIIRNSRPMAVDVEIGERPTTVEIGEGPSVVEEPGEIPATKGAWRGLDVRDITPELAQRYHIRQNRGVVVINVEPDSPADEAGIIIGDVIDSINNEPIQNTADYNRVTQAIKGNTLVRTARGYTVIKSETKD